MLCRTGGARNLPATYHVPPYPPLLPCRDWRNHYESAFRPERWLAEGPKPLYLTFGTGAHTCLGMSFVYLVGKVWSAGGCGVGAGQWGTGREVHELRVPWGAGVEGTCGAVG